MDRVRPKISKRNFFAKLDIMSNFDFGLTASISKQYIVPNLRSSSVLSLNPLKFHKNVVVCINALI